MLMLKKNKVRRKGYCQSVATPVSIKSVSLSQLNVLFLGGTFLQLAKKKLRICWVASVQAMGTQVSRKDAIKAMRKKASLPGVVGKLIIQCGKLSDVCLERRNRALYIFLDCFKMFYLLKVILNFLFSGLWCVLSQVSVCGLGIIRFCTKERFFSHS